MGINECKKDYLKEVQVDQAKINSLIKLAKVRIKAIKQIKKDKETVTIITEGYYEAIKELLIALLLKWGLKSNNHECLISFFNYKYPKYQYETMTLHQLKKIRNRINYDGAFIQENYLKNNELEFNHIIKLLNNLIKPVLSQKYFIRMI